MSVPTTQPFTLQQIQNFIAYEEVRQSRRFNMWSTQASQAAGLDREEHVFVIKNFTALKAQAEEDDHIMKQAELYDPD